MKEVESHKKVDCISGGLREVSETCRKSEDERLAKHPCFSKESSHKYARMHLAVAPKCNIQCNYCVRKYDCVNEGRPGVTSKVITPEEAFHKAYETKVKLDALSVVGIAGPGDPLANPEETFETFRRIKISMPEVILCLSTNGLLLPEYIENIKHAEVSHVTITINAVDPLIGSQIYSHVFYRGEKYTGVDAAKLLIEQQLKGAKLLKEAGIIVKINSVLIPGVNDSHLQEVSAKAKELDADIYNIMPYIPCSGSPFEKLGVMERPSVSMVKELQQECGKNMELMRHCKQCRADAVGFLGKELEPSSCRKRPPGKSLMSKCTCK